MKEEEVEIVMQWLMVKEVKECVSGIVMLTKEVNG